MLPTARQPGGPRGFTLLELLIVLATMAILAAMAAPRYGRSLMRFRVESAAFRISEDLEQAWQLARTTGTGQTVVFDTAADTYAWFGRPDPDHPGLPFFVALSDAPYRVDLQSADFGGSPVAAFDGFGQPAGGGKVVVGSGGIQRTVLLSGDSGRTRVE